MRYKFRNEYLYMTVYFLYLLFEVASNYTFASSFLGELIVFVAFGFILLTFTLCYKAERNNLIGKLIKTRIIINTSLLLVSIILSVSDINTNFLISLIVKFVFLLVLINIILSYHFAVEVDNESSPIYDTYNIAFINILGEMFKDANTKGSENTYLNELRGQEDSLKQKIFSGKEYALSSGDYKTFELIYTLLSTSVIFHFLGPLI